MGHSIGARISSRLVSYAIRALASGGRRRSSRRAPNHTNGAVSPEAVRLYTVAEWLPKLATQSSSFCRSTKTLLG